MKLLSHVWLWNPMDSSLPDSSVHEIFQARVQEWAAISFSRASSQPRDQTRISCIADRRFTVWATKEDNQTKISDIIRGQKDMVMQKCLILPRVWTIL